MRCALIQQKSLRSLKEDTYDPQTYSGTLHGSGTGAGIWSCGSSGRGDESTIVYESATNAADPATASHATDPVSPAAACSDGADDGSTDATADSTAASYAPDSISETARSDGAADSSTDATADSTAASYAPDSISETACSDGAADGSTDTTADSAAAADATDPVSAPLGLNPETSGR
jgi:hypothetical protein